MRAPSHPGGFPGAGAQLAPEPLDEEDLEEVGRRLRTRPGAGKGRLGVQGLEECLPPPARPDPLRVQGRDGRKRNRQASSTPQLDACGEQQRRAGIIRGGPRRAGFLRSSRTARWLGARDRVPEFPHLRVPGSSRAHPVPSGLGCRDSAEHAWPRPRRSRCREGGPSGTKRAHSPRDRRVRVRCISRRRSVRKLLSRSSMSRGQRLQEADAVRGRRNAQEASGAMDHRAQPTDAWPVLHQERGPRAEAAGREGEAAEERRVRKPCAEGGNAAELSASRPKLPGERVREPPCAEGGKAAELGDRFCTRNAVPRAEATGREGEAAGGERVRESPCTEGGRCPGRRSGDTRPVARAARRPKWATGSGPRAERHVQQRSAVRSTPPGRAPSCFGKSSCEGRGRGAVPAP